MANGRDPETIGLRDWLDAGYVMLVDGADATARTLLDELFASESEDDLNRGFAALRSEMDYRAAQARKAEGEARKRSGGPTHVRRVAPGVLEDALAEWQGLTGGGGEPDGDGGAV